MLTTAKIAACKDKEEPQVKTGSGQRDSLLVHKFCLVIDLLSLRKE